MTEAMVPRKKLEGKVVIITGGASGIGEGTARLFSNHGPRMIVIADIQDDLGQQVAESIGTDRCTYMHCDVSDEDQVKAVVDSTVQNYGTLDIMFSNAGIQSISDQTVLDLDLSGFDRLFAVNVRGMAACVKRAARAMVEKGVRGTIVCTGSVTASCGGVKLTDYYMSKHAVLGLVRSACTQLGMHGIRVNCVSPALVPTPGTSKFFDMGIEELEKLMENAYPLKGSSLKVKQVAETVLFLASEDAEFVTGQNIILDGGYLISPKT